MDFQKLLLDVGNSLSVDEVKSLAFLCTDLLGRSLTSVESASDLFSRLADQDYLSAERPHFLTELLLIIQRNSLIRNLRLNNWAPTTRRLVSPYRKLLYDLSEEITDDDLKNVKFLLAQQLPRRKLQHVSTLEVFLEMEHMELIGDDNLTLLETIFQKVCPILNSKISQFKARQAAVTHTRPIAEEMGRPRSASSPEQNQGLQSFEHERTASCEMPEELRSFPLCPTQSSMHTSNTSMDLPDVFPGVDECEALSHRMSRLNTKTSSCSSLKGYLRVDVLEMPLQENKASSERQMSQPTNTNTEDLETYPMTAVKRGTCVIINNYDFSQCKFLQNRKGTFLDEENLYKVFQWLGFEVVIRSDCNREEILSTMQELGNRDHSEVDCLVCCILSHGFEGGVYGVDGSKVKIKELTKPVNGSNCASLVEKPKLFFIQACQGNSEQNPVYIESDGPVCSDAVRTESIPCDADFLLGMATVPSFVSFRERKNGTWFIQSLCQNLVQMVPRGVDLLSILTKVNADVSQKTDSTGLKKQMPQPTLSLRKKVVFPVPEASPPSLPHTVKHLLY